MKAAVMHEFGPPEVLRYEDVPDPVVGRGEVLLRVRSVSVHLTFPEATVVVRRAPVAVARARRAELRAGEWALVMGAAGALGGFVVQVAKLVGAHVIAAASSDERAAAARECGADIAVNYRAEDLLEAVLRVTEGRGVDVVFENVGDRALWPKSFGSLGFRGRLVTAGADAGGRVELGLGRVYHRLQRIIASPRSSLADIERTLAESRAGRIRSVRIDRVLPLAEAAVGHRLLQERQVIGKVVLEPPAP